MATVTKPEEGYVATGSRNGFHTEHLSFILTEMQVLPRNYADAKW